MPEANLQHLSSFLHREIPLAQAMQVSVVQWDESGLRLAAPLSANRNHHGTAFAGSQAAAGILAGWCLVHLKLDEAGLPNQLVIRDSFFAFEQPVAGDFQVKCDDPGTDFWAHFFRNFRKKGKARVKLAGCLLSSGVAVGRFRGEYVALHAGQAVAQQRGAE